MTDPKHNMDTWGENRSHDLSINVKALLEGGQVCGERRIEKSA
jgi:hypothetical protein